MSSEANGSRATETNHHSEPAANTGTPGAPRLWLASLRVEGYRAIEDCTFSFQPGLNVIIGANNSAKTALVDALRVVLNLGSFENKRDYIKVRFEDIFVDNSTTGEPRTIRLTAAFSGANDPDLMAQFYELVCLDEADAEEEGDANEEKRTIFKLAYTVNFEYSTQKLRYEYVGSDTRGGPALANSVSAQSLDSLQAIYLEPLRDLVNDKSKVGAEIEQLIRSHTTSGKDEERAKIPEKLKEHALNLVGAITENAHARAASESLSDFARPYEIKGDSLRFVPSGVGEGLLRTMQPLFEHALHGQNKLPLSSNGLGINQLVYASIVLSRRGMADTDKGVHRFFLIEEPEAHLHPQLQDSFFQSLNKITDHQIFVTSHSPTITAKTDLDKIIVLQRDMATGKVSAVHLATVYGGDERQSDKRYLEKFLDVTRSQVLFAHGAVFVEGVTEGMLVQRFSELLGLNLRDHAIEVVVVEAKAGFKHFVPLFDNGAGSYRRAAFITDSDVNPDDILGNEDYHVDGAGDTFEPVGSNSVISTGCGTFEFGLLRTAASLARQGKLEMMAMLIAALKEAAPAEIKDHGKEDQFVKDFLDQDDPLLAYKKMKQKKEDTDLAWSGSWSTNTYFTDSKSEYAFYLAERLAELTRTGETDTERFVVPRYIRKAISYVVGNAELTDEDTDGTDG